ncbi:MAG: hypothetical protein KDD44_14680, partial [Bdellovibrionales bacterium]|nr:hypothetical protein [Bdellovibrionales bacterium]
MTPQPAFEGIVVRLDEPCDPSTQISDEISFKGWVVPPAGNTSQDLPDSLQLQLLVTEGPTSVAPGAGLTGERFSIYPTPETALVQRTSFVRVSDEDECHPRGAVVVRGSL